MRRPSPSFPGLIPVLSALLAPLAIAQPAPEKRAAPGVGLTVYSAPFQPSPRQPVWNPVRQRYEVLIPGFAVVKDWRKINLEAGRNALRFTEVAKEIDPTTVSFKSLTDPRGTAVLEQNYEYDLVSAEKILQRYIDRPITLVLTGEKAVAGKLLAFDGAQIVLQTGSAEQPIEIIQRQDNLKNIRFSALPGGLIAHPTLVWILESARGGEHLVQVAYQTGSISWNADYIAVVSRGDTTLDLSAWVTINNQSGAAYPEAELKLVAGDVHRAPPPGLVEEDRAELFAAKRAGEAEAGFAEKAFFEYHLYTLGRPTTIPDSSLKQIELFHPVMDVPARKAYLYYGASGVRPYGGGPYLDRNYGLASNTKVDIYLEFKNGKEGGLGIPLPAGRVRVHKRDDADGSLEFIGEDRIDHTPRDEEVRLKLGSAFDIVGERKQTDFQVDTDQRWIRESFEIRLRNHKTEDVKVLVKENLYRWANWEIEKKSHDYKKEDARTAVFPLLVPRDGEAVLTYTVRYTW